ncbi:MAG: glycosyltransferase [Syntrophorhabdaceae bacterium]|nr:glycosyltransferase [Syntrophorhabdaceae bacterium]
MTVAINSMGNCAEVVTLDGKDVPWIADFPGIVHGLGPSFGKYRFNRRLIPWLKTHAREFDAVIVHGIWQFQSIGTWIAARTRSFPYFVFIHGALDPWFKRAYPAKHMKKWLYWPWAEYRVLRDAKAVLFTCEEEKNLARQSFWMYQANEEVVECCVPDYAGDPDRQREFFLQRFPLLQGKRLILFLSRIHRKKGCDLLIESFARAAEGNPELRLVMAGPDQEGWQRKLEALSKKRGVEDRITWTGMLTGDLKWGAFHAAEVFILPSHSENFGIVVAEALACGLPVLITDKVNIWKEIIGDGAGFAETDNLDGVVRLLERWLGLSPEEIRRIRTQARACFERRFDVRRVAEKLMSIIKRENGFH